MKSMIVRGVITFAAGAGCATVVAQMYEQLPEIGEVEYEKLGTEALLKLEQLGAYTVLVNDFGIGMQGNPSKCPPLPPIPKKPVNAADQRLVRRGLEAAVVLNESRYAGQEQVVYQVLKCETPPPRG